MLTLIIYLFLMLIFKPYDYDNANSLEILSTLCSILNILFVNSFYYTQTLKHMAALAIVTFIFNMTFGIITTIHIVRFIRNLFNSFILRIKILIINKLTIFRTLINKNYINSYTSKVYWNLLRKSITSYNRIKRDNPNYTIHEFYQKLAIQNRPT